MITKIIHHIAPKDKTKWHPLWEKCKYSWENKFLNHQHILWNDENDIDDLVEKYYPQYWKTYQSFPAHIMKIDFARLCILHKYGGIYSDMDVFCYQEFQPKSETYFYILQAPYGDIPIENALMISPQKHIFLEKAMEMSIESFYKFNKTHTIKFPFDDQSNREFILNVAGPKLLLKVFEQYNYKNVKILSGELFNNHGMAYHPKLITRHFLTGLWGKESFEHIENCKKQKKIKKTTKKYIVDTYFEDIKKYAYMDDIDINNFDFYTDYTNGQFLKV